MKYEQIESADVPLELLLEADPSEENISSYLADAWCYAAKDEHRVQAVCVVKSHRAVLAEICNIAVNPDLQGQGIGSHLLKFVLADLSNKGINRVELGTGTFGYQLTFYQRIGFRVEAVDKDYFLNYPEPIFENGIQHKDRLRLYLDLS
ncbi:GNAT family N-acetyltransferase [Shewanella corallii]|uniref:GNAT family N-acetyltransferase n=1 Tax=Shewanella corallii TaxID=560080 RepID=A0ABT0N6P0_9GAMM|nr:GNAT family N-acetyltransferase [Shewanella corallii]MCL2914074.1 GNAT family N-acetyltransferase [Shewanella corallii]